MVEASAWGPWEGRVYVGRVVDQRVGKVRVDSRATGSRGEAKVTTDLRKGSVA